MRTNIVLDDGLIAEALKTFGVRTKREAVDIALREALQIRRQAALIQLWGLGWDGDLDQMRTDEPVPEYG